MTSPVQSQKLVLSYLATARTQPRSNAVASSWLVARPPDVPRWLDWTFVSTGATSFMKPHDPVVVVLPARPPSDALPSAPLRTAVQVVAASFCLAFASSTHL